MNGVKLPVFHKGCGGTLVGVHVIQNNNSGVLEVTRVMCTICKKVEHVDDIKMSSIKPVYRKCDWCHKEIKNMDNACPHKTPGVEYLFCSEACWDRYVSPQIAIRDNDSRYWENGD